MSRSNIRPPCDPTKPVPKNSTFRDKFKNLTTAKPPVSPTKPVVPPPTKAVVEIDTPIDNYIDDTLAQMKERLEYIQKNFTDLKKTAIDQKEETINTLKAENDMLKEKMFVYECNLKEALETKEKYFKLNRELNNKLEMVALTHYDNVTEQEISCAQTMDLLDKRMTSDIKPFTYKSIKRKKQAPERPAKKQKAVEDLSIITKADNAITTEQKLLFGNDDLYDKIDFSELGITNSQEEMLNINK